MGREKWQHIPPDTEEAHYFSSLLDRKGIGPRQRTARRVNAMAVEILGAHEIEALRRAGRVARATLEAVGARLAPGISTADIERWVREDTELRGGTPSQLGYHGFPAAVCTSRNNVVCHGIPRADEILQDGDIINVDVTTEIGGFHGDTSATFFIGEPSAEGASRGRRRAPMPRRGDRRRARGGAARRHRCGDL